METGPKPTQILEGSSIGERRLLNRSLMVASAAANVGGAVIFEQVGEAIANNGGDLKVVALAAFGAVVQMLGVGSAIESAREYSAIRSAADQISQSAANVTERNTTLT